jgi:replication initiation protein RepC
LKAVAPRIEQFTGVGVKTAQAVRVELARRSIRRILGQLTDLKLIVAKDSPNGKRFAIRNLAGEIIDAYGFDLTPIYARRGEWTTMLVEQKVMREIRKRAYDEVTVARRATEEAISALAQHFPSLTAPISKIATTRS